jgi:16S rRNA (cytosine967-C5)-methyltransferase
MLNHAATLLKPGGQLVYCNCSLSPLEGERQVFKFLRSHADFTLSAIRAEELGGQSQLVTQAGLLRCLPSMSLGNSRGLDGFFAARMLRNSG